MLEELENTARLIKQNADSVESKSLDKLNSLYAEKRRARKQYQEEHNRIVAQFTHVSSQFILLLIIYRRCLQTTVIRLCLASVVCLIHLATTFLGQGYLSLPSHIDQLWACPQHYILGPSTKYILAPPPRSKLHFCKVSINLLSVSPLSPILICDLL
jgi:tyrosine-protein kinase Fer